MAALPQRIVCLTEETTETLYRLGVGDRVVGVSGFTRRPPEARRNAEVISTYLEADLEKIATLKPDLILAWSDLQAPVVADLITAGYEVYTFNQRTVDGIFGMIARLGRLVGRSEAAAQLAAELNAHLDEVRERAAARSRRPTVYFEEWYDPLISGIGWVSELVEIAGGRDLFAELSQRPDAKGRIIADPGAVVEAAPDVMLASWCGQKFDPEHVRARPGWGRIPAVAGGHVYAIDSSTILQPGPAALTDGVGSMAAAFDRWAADQTAAV